jgi:AraC-like DNA-binding protein
VRLLRSFGKAGAHKPAQQLPRLAAHTNQTVSLAGSGLSDRSLRRQLQQQRISFRGLLDELRMQIAPKYLRAIRLANEYIAPALAFSDAANFRRAFPRWTNKSPSAIRYE